MNDFIVDVALILVFALITFWYSKKGFVKTVLDSVSWIIAVVCAKILTEPAYNFLRANTSLLGNADEPIAKIAVLVLLFFVLFVLLKWLIHIIDKFFKIPVLKQVNGVLGLIVGMICGLFAIIIICMLLQLSVNVVYNSDYVVAIESSRIVSFVVNNEKILNSLNF